MPAVHEAFVSLSKPLRAVSHSNLVGDHPAAARDFRDVYTRYADLNPDIAAKAKARLREMGLTVSATAKKRKTTPH